jgi:hypothetical protein
MQEAHKPSTHQTYQIIVSSHLDPKWTDWFDGFCIAPQANGETRLSGAVEDQAALHSLLAKIRDLGLTLLSLTQVKN